MIEMISAETYFTIALLLIAYCTIARAVIFVTVRLVYTDSHPAHFAAFLDVSTIFAAVGIGMSLCFGSLLV